MRPVLGARLRKESYRDRQLSISCRGGTLLLALRRKDRVRVLALVALDVVEFRAVEVDGGVGLAALVAADPADARVGRLRACQRNGAG